MGLKASSLARNGITAGFLMAMGILASCGKSSEQQGAHSISLPAPKPSPAAPAAVSALSEDGKVTLRWHAAEGAAAYNIYSAGAAGVKPVKEQKLASVKVPPFEHANLKNGASYFYVVTAVNDAGESQPSMETGAMPRGSAPGVPAKVAASVVDNGEIIVKWDAVPGAKMYNVYMADKPGTAKANGQKTAVSVTSYSQNSLRMDRHYYFAVTAVNDDGESPSSPETGASARMPMPGRPSGVSVMVDKGQITVKWEPVAGAASYNVYVSKTEKIATKSSKSVSSKETRYVDSGLKKGDMFFYAVSAVSGSGEGELSNKVGGRL